MTESCNGATLQSANMRSSRVLDSNKRLSKQEEREKPMLQISIMPNGIRPIRSPGILSDSYDVEGILRYLNRTSTSQRKPGNKNACRFSTYDHRFNPMTR
jgi:hypothetical protein